MPVETAKVVGRRQVRFVNLGEVAADVEHLAAGKIRTLGNWSPGQILWHLATVMNSSIDGTTLRAPWYMRLFAPLMKRRMLTKGMPAGFKLSPEFAAVFEPPTTSLEQGLETFRTAVRRQQTESHRTPSPFLGEMTREEWEQLHCRHAELHLSFLLPED